MNIGDGVFLTASGYLGTGLSHALDCNAYAVKCGSEYWLIDAGVGRETESLVARLRADGIPLDRIRALLLTHSHLDHSGGAATLHHSLKIPVWAGKQTAAIVEAGDEESSSLALAKRIGLYPPDSHFEPCPVERVLQDGESIESDGAVIQAVATPGHSSDMTSYVIRRGNQAMLFAGDTIFHGGRVSVLATWDCNPQAYAASIEKLSTMGVGAMFPGHGPWSMQNAQTHMDAAMGYVRRLVLPPNI